MSIKILLSALLGGMALLGAGCVIAHPHHGGHGHYGHGYHGHDGHYHGGHHGHHHGGGLHVHGR